MVTPASSYRIRPAKQSDVGIGLKTIMLQSYLALLEYKDASYEPYLRQTVDTMFTTGDLSNINKTFHSAPDTCLWVAEMTTATNDIQVVGQ